MLCRHRSCAMTCDRSMAGTVWQVNRDSPTPTEGSIMGQYQTRKGGNAAKRETIARRQARAVKRGAIVTRGGRTVVRKDGGR